MLQSLILLASLALDPTITLIDSGKPDVNRRNLESKIAEANQGPGVRPIVIPHGFTVDRPVFGFGGNLQFQGDRPHAALICRAGSPPLILGINPSPGFQEGPNPRGKRPWTGDHVVEARGKVDATLAPTLGAWAGISTFGKDGLPDTIYAFLSCPFTHPLGKSWEAIPSATWDVCYEASPDTKLGLQVCGASDDPLARPVSVRTVRMLDGNPGHEIHFATADGRDRWFMCRMLDEGGVRRFTFSIDLPSGTVSAWSGGKSVPIDGRGLGDDFKPESGLRFADSDFSAWKLGGFGLLIDAFDGGFGAMARYTFYGCRVASGCPYGTGPDGVQTILATGRTATDSDRYGAGDRATLIGYVDLAAPPKDSRFARWATSRPSSVSGHGMALLAGQHTHPMNTGTRVRIVDLDLQGGSPDAPTMWPYGDGIWCGGTLQGYSFERGRSAGGRNGFGGLMAGATYPVTFRDWTFRGGTGNGFQAKLAIVQFDGLTHVEYPARYGMAFIECEAAVGPSFQSEGGPGLLANVALLRGGAVELDRPVFDTEQEGSPHLAPVYAERGVNGNQPGTTLIIRGGTIDTKAGPDVPTILLGDVSKQPGFGAYLDVVGLKTWGDGERPAVATDGPGWTGSVRGFLSGKPARRAHTPTYGPPGVIAGIEP